MPDYTDATTSCNQEPELSRSQTPPKPRSCPTSHTWLALPAPLKRLFSRFPLRILPPSPLPIRTAPHRDQHTLYIFTTASAATHNGPSFNPTCLKWQTYLKFLGVDFQTVASTNHASPTGALPFLIPAVASDAGSSDDHGQKGAVASNRLQKWAREKGMGREEPESIRYEAYMALLDHRIRRAWLYTLYLTPNFAHVATPLYIHSSTRSHPVRLALSHSLQAAAVAELLATSAIISPEALYADAEAALGALSALLGDDQWFFGAEEPGLFDASVFAYTYLLFGGLEWVETGIKERRGWENLRRHKEEIAGAYYGDGAMR